MKKKICLVLIAVLMFQVIGAMSALAYNVTDNSHADITTQGIAFSRTGNTITATTTVDLLRSMSVSLILAGTKDGVVVTDVAPATVDGTLSCSLTYVEGTTYKAYLWNTDSIEPYTNVASYNSASVDLEYLKVGNQAIALTADVNEYTVTDAVSTTVYAKAADAGTVITATDLATLPGDVTVTVTSADGTASRVITLHVSATVLTGLYDWLDAQGIDRSVGITTYLIEE